MAADRTSGGIGATLREARERRGVSLRQIANATKISVAVLDALERNDISRLPGGIFGRAFVRAYAVEVGLDPETTIQDFIAQFPSDSVTVGHPTTTQVEQHDTLENDRRMAGTFLWLIVISVPVAGLLLYFATAGRRVPPAATPAPATTEQESKPVVDVPPPPTSDVRVAAPPAAARSQPTPAAAPLAASTTDPAADHLTVLITAKRPCWVSATVDGQKAIERLLQAGEQKTVEMKRDMALTAGDAGAITLAFNGADARPLGKTGEVVTARFNRNNYKDYLQVR
jgi:cytoskeletal protein RodZ